LTSQTTAWRVLVSPCTMAIERLWVTFIQT